MGDWLKDANNEFWTSARDHYLDERLDESYRSPKKKLIEKWLRDEEKKTVVIRQVDFHSDPLVIELGKGGYRVFVSEDDPEPEFDAALDLTHGAAISSCTDLGAFISSWFYGELRVYDLWKRRRDNYYAARIFLRP